MAGSPKSRHLRLQVGRVADRRMFRLALGLAFLAGFIDATGFILLGGIFVASPETFATMFAVNLANGWGRAAQIGLLVIGVVSGAMAGTRIVHRSGRNPRTAVVVIVACLLATAFYLNLSDVVLWPGFLLSAAIGMAHCTLDGSDDLVAQAMSATHQLVRLGEGLADLCLGRKAANMVAPLLFGFAFLGGAVVAALGHFVLASASLGLGTVIAAILIPIALAAGRAGSRRA